MSSVCGLKTCRSEVGSTWPVDLGDSPLIGRIGSVFPVLTYGSRGRATLSTTRPLSESAALTMPSRPALNSTLPSAL